MARSKSRASAALDGRTRGSLPEGDREPQSLSPRAAAALNAHFGSSESRAPAGHVGKALRIRFGAGAGPISPQAEQALRARFGPPKGDHRPSVVAAPHPVPAAGKHAGIDYDAFGPAVRAHLKRKDAATHAPATQTAPTLNAGPDPATAVRLALAKSGGVQHQAMRELSDRAARDPLFRAQLYAARPGKRPHSHDAAALAAIAMVKGVQK